VNSQCNRIYTNIITETCPKLRSQLSKFYETAAIASAKCSPWLVHVPTYMGCVSRCENKSSYVPFYRINDISGTSVPLEHASLSIGVAIAIA